MEYVKVQRDQVTDPPPISEQMKKGHVGTRAMSQEFADRAAGHSSAVRRTLLERSAGSSASTSRGTGTKKVGSKHVRPPETATYSRDDQMSGARPRLPMATGQRVAYPRAAVARPY